MTSQAAKKENVGIASQASKRESMEIARPANEDSIVNEKITSKAKAAKFAVKPLAGKLCCFYLLDCLLHKNVLGKKRNRCGNCMGCRAAECKVCPMCLDKPKYGGPGKKKKCCVKRKCLGLQSNSAPPLKSSNVQQLVKNIHAATADLIGMSYY